MPLIGGEPQRAERRPPQQVQPQRMLSGAGVQHGGREDDGAESDPNPIRGRVSERRQRGHHPGDGRRGQQCVPRSSRLQRSHGQLMELDIVDVGPAVSQPDLGASVIQPEVVVTKGCGQVGQIDNEVQRG